MKKFTLLTLTAALVAGTANANPQPPSVDKLASCLVAFSYETGKDYTLNPQVIKAIEGAYNANGQNQIANNIYYYMGKIKGFEAAGLNIIDAVGKVHVNDCLRGEHNTTLVYNWLASNGVEL